MDFLANSRKDLVHGRWLGLWSLVSWIFAVAGLFCILAFLFARTPVAVNTVDQTVMTSDWPAGVGNRGVFYLWWTARDNPVLFIVALAAFLHGPLTLVRVHRRQQAAAEQEGIQQPATHAAVKAFLLVMLMVGLTLTAGMFLQFGLGLPLVDWPTANVSDARERAPDTAPVPFVETESEVVDNTD